MSANDELEDRARARLRQRRFELGLTLAEVAEAAGMHTSTVSRLESGARRLTLRHVAQLGGALGLAPAALLEDAPGESAADAAGGVGASAAAPADGKLWEPLSDESTRGIRAYRVTLPETLSEPRVHSHEGMQWLYVLSGRLRLVLGRHDVVLERGCAAQFSTWTPHWIGTVGTPARLLVLFDPEGARLPLLDGFD